MNLAPFVRVTVIVAFAHNPQESEAMWLPEVLLQQLGFRQQSRYYWRCDSQFDLPANTHISIFVSSLWNEDGQEMVIVDAFHVTFRVATDHLHFYYHEHGDNTWRPGGNTSRAEIARHGLKLAPLRDTADALAAAVVAAWRGELIPRGGRN